MKGQPKFPFGTPPLFFSIVCFFFLYQNHPEIIVITPIKIHPILIIIIRWNSTQLTGPATLIFELLISPCSFIFLTLWVGESQWKKWRQVMRFGYVNTCLNIYTYMLGERFRRSRALPLSLNEVAILGAPNEPRLFILSSFHLDRSPVHSPIYYNGFGWVFHALKYSMEYGPQF